MNANNSYVPFGYFPNAEEEISQFLQESGIEVLKTQCFFGFIHYQFEIFGVNFSMKNTEYRGLTLWYTEKEYQPYPIQFVDGFATSPVDFNDGKYITLDSTWNTTHLRPDRVLETLKLWLTNCQKCV